MSEIETCPRCGGTEFIEHDCGPDGYEDDIFYISITCNNCGLWKDGWTGKWLIDVENWRESEDAEEYSQWGDDTLNDYQDFVSACHEAKPFLQPVSAIVRTKTIRSLVGKGTLSMRVKSWIEWKRTKG